MPRMGGNYGSYEGGSGLADLLSGAVSGFRTGSDLAAQRAAQRLAEEREARYEAERLAQAEERRYDRERQGRLDEADAAQRAKTNQAADAERALRGIVPTENVDLTARATNPEDSVQRALGSLVRGGGIDLTPSVRQNGETVGTAETPDSSGYNTRARYSKVGDYAVDNTLAPDYRAGMEQAQERDVRRLKEQDRATEWEREDEVYGRRRVDDLADAKEIGRFNSGLRMGEYANKAALDSANAPAFDVKRAASLRTEYRVRTSDFAKQAQALGRIRAAADNPNPQGADDVALIFNYMKMLDPTSVVRESEYATAANTGLSVPENVRRQYNKALEGKVLTPKQRQDMLSSALRQGEGARRQLQEMSAYYSGLAAQEGIPPDNVVYDYFGGVEAPQEGQGQQVAAYKSRVRELVSGGMDLDQAKAKARAEMED